MKDKLVVLGAGGHSKVVIATARAAGYNVTHVLDDDPHIIGSTILGVEVTGPIDRPHLAAGAACVLAIGSNGARKRLAEHLNYHWASVIHPQAVIDSTVTIGEGTVIFAGVVIQPDTEVGAHAILNTGCSVDHDCSVGAFAHIAPGARLAGGCSVGDGAFMGIGAVMTPGLRVGSWSTVGAGAAVIDDIPDGVVAAGVPARVLRRVDS